MGHPRIEEISQLLKNEINGLGRAKRMKIKTLLTQFGYGKRTEEIATRITEALVKSGVIINPSIMKVGEQWLVNHHDQVYLSLLSNEGIEQENSSNVPFAWEQDVWFEELKGKTFRTEREVETKFIIPLLYKLGYSENDRYDGMTVKGAHGSKTTNLTVDFTIFNTDNDLLKDNVLLVVEAKKEDRLKKSVELVNARNQTKSYGMWAGAKYGLITDGHSVEVLDLFTSIGGIKVIFECHKENLKENFIELCNLIGKEKLSNYYLKHLS